MKSGKKTVQELLAERNSLLEKREAVNIRMNELIDKAKAEKRDLSPDENIEYQSLKNDFNKHSREIQMNFDLTNMQKSEKREEKSKNQLLRECLQAVKSAGKPGDFVLEREFTGLNTASIEAGGMIPLTIKDILPPLEMGLIFDKVGIPVQTGVSGNIQWPVMGSVDG